MQDENDALKQLQQNWSRYKPENRSTCLAQGMSPMPSYVEILTCIEMYDSAGTLNKGSAAGQMNQGVPLGVAAPTRGDAADGRQIERKLRWRTDFSGPVCQAGPNAAPIRKRRADFRQNARVAGSVRRKRWSCRRSVSPAPPTPCYKLR